MLRKMWFWISTSTVMSSRNPSPQSSNQPEMKVPNVNYSSHWTTIHLRSIWSPSGTHEHWLALRLRLECHRSHQPKVVTETMLPSSQGMRNCVSKMRNVTIWYPCTLQLWSQTITITRMRLTIQSHSKQQPCLHSPRNGIQQQMKTKMQLVSIKSLEISWSFMKGERFCQVIGYTWSSAMEQAMCSSSRPG